MNEDKVRIFRVAERPAFTKIDNRAVGNPQLSYRAQGILHYLLSKPDHWVVQMQDVVAHGREGRCAVYSAVGELVDSGHIERVMIRDAIGQVVKVEFAVHELPRNQRENPDSGNQHVAENQILESCLLVTTDKVKIEDATKSRRATAKATAKVEIPPDWPEKLLSAWNDFVEHRRQSGKKLTERAATAILKKIAPWGHAKAAAALTQSVENGWQGVFEPKASNSFSSAKSFSPPTPKAAGDGGKLAPTNKQIVRVYE